MKRLLLFMCALVLTSVSAVAEDYPLWIAGVQVTDLNADDITGAGISAKSSKEDFKLSYDAETNTLTMDNVKVETSDAITPSIRYGDKDGILTISVSKHSSVISKNNGIESEGDLILNCDETLSVKGQYALRSHGDLTISGTCFIEATSSAIYGDASSTLDLSDIIWLEAEGGYVVIAGFGNYVGPSKPDAYYSNVSFYDSGDPYGVAARDENGDAIIGGSVDFELISYAKIGDFIVTGLNVDEQPFSAPCIAGNVTFDKEKLVLILEDAIITSTDDIAIRLIEGAQIVLKGDNKIIWGPEVESRDVLEIRSDLLISGGGSMTADDGSIYVYGKENPKLQIKDVTIDLGIELEYGGTIEIENSKISGSLYSDDEGIWLLNNCTLSGFCIDNGGDMTFNDCTLTYRCFLNGGITNFNHSTIELENTQIDLYAGAGIMNYKTLNINANSTVSSHGLYFGYWGEEKISSLNVDNSTLRLKGDAKFLYDGKDIILCGAAVGSNLTITGAELYEDNGVNLYEGEDGYFEIRCYDDPATDWVEIGPLKYFKIGDLEVTGRNLEEQPYSDPSIEGTVTYDKDTGVLTLDGVSVTSESVGLDVGHGTYKGRVSQIEFKGENTITSESDMIYNRSALTISGSGSLKGNNAINNDDTYAYLRIYGCNLECGGIGNHGSLDIANSRVVANGIYNSAACSMNITSSTLTIEDKIEDGIYNDGTIYIGTDSHVDATGPKYGYRSEETTSSVTIDNSTLRLNNGDGIVVAKGYNLNLWSEVELETSGGATLYEGKDEYFEAKRGETPSEWTVFTVPADKKTYDIHVGGTQVTGMNYENVTSPSITGQVSYDPLARRLTLTNATIGDGGVSFGYSAGSAELMLNGDNAITGVDPMGCSLIANQELTITSADGKGKLAIDNEMFSAFTGGTSTVIRNCELDFKSAGYGMTGMGPLTIESGKVRVKGETGSLLAFSDITFGEDIIFDKPDNCYYNKETSQLEVEGELVTGEVIIRYLKNYDIMVGTTKVNSDNYNDIKPAELKAGSISFDPEKYELILSEAQLEGSGITANPGIEELTLVVDGECSITGAVVPMKLMCPAFIISKNCADAGKPGQGILNDKLTIATDGTGVYFDGMLFLNDIAMTVTAGYKALAGSGPGSLIYINTSNIEVTGTNDGAITSVGLLSLYDRTRFTNPAQSFDEETGWVSEGGVAAKSVTIKYYMPGDANVDYLVDVADVRAVANDIWEVEQPWFEAYNADLNTDDVINVTDIVGVVDIILESSATARAKNHAMLARRGAQEANDRLSLVNRNGLLTAALTNADGYYGLQMNLRLSPGQTLNDIILCGACADSHQVAWRQTGDDTFRVVVYALSPAALIGGSSQMLTFDIEGEGTVEADDILAVTTDGTRRMLAPAMGDVVTGITETMATEHDATGTYDLNGRKVSENSGLKKGIYIRNGKKFIVK